MLFAPATQAAGTGCAGKLIAPAGLAGLPMRTPTAAYRGKHCHLAQEHGILAF
jgi:hypothetical protein